VTSLSDGEVRSSDVLRWAQEQAIYLSPPSLHHVLLYLCINAFYKDENREGKKPGNVLTGRTRLRTIQRYTGLSRRTVQRALDGLQDQGYVLVSMDGGNEPNEIFVAWSEAMDDVRTEVRAGLRDLPKVFQRDLPEALPAVEKPLATVTELRPRGVSE
jgi:hypothetical protein